MIGEILERSLSKVDICWGRCRFKWYCHVEPKDNEEWMFSSRNLDIGCNGERVRIRENSQ